MNRKQFGRCLSVWSFFSFYVWDIWDDWWKAQGRPGSPPEQFDVSYAPGNKFRISYDDGSETKTDVFSISEFLSSDDENDKYTMLWHAGYYDGPTSGLCEHVSGYYWFEIHEWEYDNPFYLRSYKLYPLSKEEVLREQKWHNRWLSIKNGDSNKPLDYWYNNMLSLIDRTYTDRNHSDIIEEFQLLRIEE